MKKFLSFMLILICFCLPTSVLAQSPSDTQTATLTIYHTNDVHGYVDAADGSIGLARVAALKKATPDAILVDAGDATQGLPIASLTQGRDIIALMNTAGYDAMALGNHEFDYGRAILLQNAAQAAFPLLSANVFTEDGQLLLNNAQDDQPGCHTLVERNGIRVGFFGLTTTETATSTNPDSIAGLTFGDAVQAASREIDHLQAEGADVIVALAHLGDASAGTDCSAADLAQSLPAEDAEALDLLIDGHSHTVENDTVNGVHIVQTGCNLAAVGEIQMTVNPDGSVDTTDQLLDAQDLAAITPDAAVESAIAAIKDTQRAITAEPVGQAATTLWGGWIGSIAAVRCVETNYGDLAADAFAAAGQRLLDQTSASMPVIGVENGGGLRAAIANGTITRGDLLATFPFANTLYMKAVTPSCLYQVMEVAGECLDGQDTGTGMLLQTAVSGSFLQISGFQVVYDPDGATGNKVAAIILDGQTQPLDPNDTTTPILMVSNNYVMSGGGGFSMLADLPKYGEAGGEVETIQAYIQSQLAHGVLENYRGTAGRIRFTGSGYQPHDYTASLRVTHTDGTPAANTPVSFRVDGNAWQWATTDADGLLTLTLSDGGHGIRLSDDQAEVYVDNYLGLGLVEDALRTFPTLIYAEPQPQPSPQPGADTDAPTATATSESVTTPATGTVATGTMHTPVWLLGSLFLLLLATVLCLRCLRRQSSH